MVFFPFENIQDAKLPGLAAEKRYYQLSLACYGTRTASSSCRDRLGAARGLLRLLNKAYRQCHRLR